MRTPARATPFFLVRIADADPAAIGSEGDDDPEPEPPAPATALAERRWRVVPAYLARVSLKALAA